MLTESPAAASFPAAGRTTRVAFTATVFIGASLLFLVEPMVAKMLLPSLGGSPAVWNTATVFFQFVLLGGYAFAHLTLRGLGPRRQPALQLVALLLPLAVLPIALPGGWTPPTESSPVGWTLLVLTVMVGAPFFMLSTVSPTLQRWFSATSHPHAADPYFLYAAGNVGSLLALLAYPIVIEPNLTLTAQAQIWAALYVVFVVCCLGCAVLVWRDRAGAILAGSVEVLGGENRSEASEVSAAPASGSDLRDRIDNRTRLRWIAFAAVPSGLMLGVTRHISSDVAAMPLLWVVPLSLYLVTFIVAFGRNPDRPVLISSRVLKLVVVPLALTFFGLVSTLWFVLAVNLVVFFAAAMVAHGRLASERPRAEKLTEFYLLLSVGGLVGGVLTAIVAPVIFDSVIEYPIMIVLSLALIPRSDFERSASSRTESAKRSPGREAAARLQLSRLDLVVLAGVVGAAIAAVVVRSSGTQAGLTLSIVVAAAGAGAAYAFARTPGGYAVAIGIIVAAGMLVPANPTSYQSRTFFGVHRVYVDQTRDDRHVLLNGTTVHGMEYFVGDHAHQPTAYYHPTGPVGQWFAAPGAPDPRVGVVGLGSGALAWYGRSGQQLDFFEIDEEVVRISESPDLFTFVERSPADISMIVGDGRLQLADSGQTYDRLVIDAFSGDAIPVHLLTDEAVQLYLSHLSENGSMAFHISNRYFDFEPIVARLAEENGLVAYINTDAPTAEEDAEGKFTSTWVVLARTPEDARIARLDGWRPAEAPSGTPLWTDDYSDLLHVFRLE